MVIERELSLSLVGHRCSPPGAISIDALRELAPPTSILPRLIRADGASLKLTDLSRTRIRIR